MAFFVTMFICNLLIPLVMVIGGYCMGKNPPQKINGVAGYRTKRSKMNMDTWLFAHRLCGKLWVRLGAVLLVLSILVQVPFARASEDAIGLMTIILEVVQIVVLIGSIILVEKALKRTFDDNGVRKLQD